MAASVRPLRLAKLRRRIEPKSLGFETSDELTRLCSIIEQKRSFDALRLGSEVSAKNYNIYVAGPPGTGKLTAVRKVLKELSEAKDQEQPGDVCYVHNFQRPYEPRALHFPAGLGERFKRTWDEFVAQLRHRLPQVYNSREYQMLVQEVVNKSVEQENESFIKLSEQAKNVGFAVKTTKDGLATVPMYNNRMLSDKDYDHLPPDVKRKIEEQRKKLTPHVAEFMQQARELQLSTQSGVEYLQRELIEQLVGPEIEKLKAEFGANKAIEAQLDAYLADMMQHPHKLIPDLVGEGSPPPGHPERALKEYQVNLLVDHSETKGRPIVYEKNPTHPNLVGKIDKVVEQGAYLTDFTMIRPGSILKAAGGFLLIDGFDLLTRPFAWQALKTSIKNGEVTIEDMGEQYGFPTMTGLKPEPIPVSFKVVLMGSNLIYHLLVRHDEDFQKLFQIKSEFDDEEPATLTNMKMVARFVATIVSKEDLAPVHADAMAALLENGMRQMENQGKLSMMFGDLANLVIEANYYAKQAGHTPIRGEHVREAVRMRRERLGLISDKYNELFKNDTLLVDVSGSAVGQINGLAVLESAGFAFGKPVRVTAQTFAGKGGVINIEREARMAGKVFNKAALIISAWLRRQFAADKPLSLNVSLAFEQSYGGIDGDSASVTEIYAMLSAIAEVPIDQGIAITGSLNQVGEVQAIGGVNEKIEGFFEVCAQKGLTGSQGVIIPYANRQNLMLCHKVLDAVEAGRFNVWAIRRIEEGVPLLMGLAAGKRDTRGKRRSFPKASLFGRVAAVLDKLAAEAGAKAGASGSLSDGANGSLNGGAKNDDSEDQA